MTKKYKRRFITLAIVSWILCYGLAVALVGVSLFTGEKSSFNINDYVGPVITSSGISILLIAILSFIVKDKLEPTVWMISVILAAVLYNITVVYVVFGIWAIDNYVLKQLCHKYKLKWQINKELDAREA